jgi:aminopeptidase N
MFKILLFVFISMMTVNAFSQAPPLEPGVSQTLAKWRAANYSDVRYKLNITLEKGAPLMKGDIEISVKLTDEGAKNDLVLDWRTTQFQNDKDKPFADVIEVNEKLVKDTVPNGVFDYQTNKEHLIVSKKYLKTGDNTIKIKFASPIKTSGSAITRYIDKEDGAEYVYSLFVPSDASTAFPVFDQPDLKARFSLSVNAPKDWRLVSNTSIQSVLNRDCGQSVVFDIETRKPIKTLPYTCGDIVSFNETKPISTYVFAFAAGDFTEIDCRGDSCGRPMSAAKTNVGGKSNSASGKSRFGQAQDLPLQSAPDLPMKIYVRKSQAEKFKAHAAEVFRLNREGVKFLEDYFDYKFPFPKYDLVLIPEFPFGGMEHAGATFLREASVIFPTEPTKNDYVSRANVIFHEAAHQWFGDTVTMKWFDDLWLKEGFAEFMAYKTLEKVMPEYNAWKIFYERNKQAAYLTDSTRGTTPIYQEIPNLSAAKSAYGNIVYRKAPSFLKQAEFYLGEKEFQTAVRAFLKNHQYANAEWTDLVKEFETASKQDLKAWANVWVKQKGLPIFRAYFYETDMGAGRFYVEQMNFRDNLFWRQKIKFSIMAWGNRISVKEAVFENGDLDGSASKIKKYIGEGTRDLSIFPNYQDYGYGIFLLDEKSRAYVLANIQTEKDDFLRAMMWGSLWDSVRETELAPADYVRLVIKNINVETDESTIQTLLGRTGAAMNYYLSDAQRDEFATQIETLLLEKMRNAPTVGQKITFYRAFLGAASSENARKFLKDVLSGKAPLKDVQLKTKDKFDIVTRLLILGDKDAPRLLAELEKTETSDEAKRYAYAAKAGIATAENKAKFWNDFVNNKEISESYIESAFAVFNSPKHSELTLPYLEKALAELPNLKRNRKIFFVNGWLGSFIGGQKSEQALNIVNKFLADNPNLDRDLRLKILENSDNLERAVKIRAKYGK